MRQIQRHMLLGVFISYILLVSSMTPNNIGKGNGLDVGSTDAKIDPVDIPTWFTNDSWIFQASIYSDTENGIFDMHSDALAFSIIDITSVPSNSGYIDVYCINISGELSGSFANSTISGDITGEITGTVLVRQADLSLLDLNITSSGILEWLFFDFDYNMRSESSYTPSFEYFDFPITVGETWMSSSTVHQNTSFSVEGLFSDQTESTEQVNGVVTCTDIENITVPCGTFTSHHIISEENESTIESWFNSTVKNIVKIYLFQENETSTNVVHLNLSSYNVQSQQIQASMEVSPSVVAVGDLVTVSGMVATGGVPVEDVDITLCIPYSNDIYSTSSDTTGFYTISFNAPLLLDPTTTTYDLGSDGLLVTAEYDGFIGYTLATLSVTGIAIIDVEATPIIQIESQSVNITCNIYSVEPLNEMMVNISGPNGFETQNVSLTFYNDTMYYLSQPYSIIGEYSYYIWVIDESGNSNISTTCSFNIISENESIDVDQTIFDRGFPIRHALDGDWAAAQCYMPLANTLTKAEIYMRKFGTPEFNLTVQIRENHPQGTLVDTLVFTPSQVPSSWDWFTLDFTDTIITPGIQYFIVCPPAPSGVTTSFGYEWGYAFGNQYDDGSFWFTRDGGGMWRDLPTMYEFCFKTYGY